MEEVIVCRCEEVTREDIEKAIEDGASTVNEIKRWTRAGMGLCQGKSCSKQVMAILAQKTGLPPAAIKPSTVRIPVRPMEIRAMTGNTGAGTEAE